MNHQDLKNLKRIARERDLEYRRVNGVPRGGSHEKGQKAKNRKRRQDARRECRSY